MPLSLDDADGSEGLSICRAQREWLVRRYKLESAIALRYFADELPVAQDDRQTDVHAIDHVRRCPKCRDWLHAAIPPDVLRRQRRLTRYCCAGMFVAFEEAEGPHKNKVTFELFRGEDPCWMVDGIRSFISFCPWCGKKLPSHPFVSD